MNGANSLVTVAIPTFNRAAYLKAALQSVVEQDYQNIEILISDNCSTDNTESVVKAFSDPRISYHRQEKNIGMVGNWNYCLEKAKGVFFMLLSDDDILERQAVTNLASMLKSSSVTLAYARFLHIDNDMKPLKLSYLSPTMESGDSFIVHSLKGQRDIVPSLTMQRTADARLTGGYPPIGTVTDLALRLYLAKKGSVAYTPQVLLKYRNHENSLSQDFEKVLTSHETLYNLANDIQNPLYEYRSLILKYYKRTLFSIILACDKLDKSSLSKFIRLAQRLRFGKGTEMLIRLFNLSFFKFLAGIRKKLKQLLPVTI